MTAADPRRAVAHTATHDGTTFVLRGWTRATPARTALVVHHGLGEHGGRYDTFARNLDGLPLDVWSFDLRGHGESGGKRGHALGLRQLADDLHALLPVIRERAGAERVLLLGHSMGAAAVGTALTHPDLPALPDFVTGLLLSAAPVKIPMSPALRVKALAARVLNRLRPSLSLSSGLASEHISSDPAEVKRYLDDPLVHDRISAALGLSLLRDAGSVVDRAGRIGLPAIVWHGVDDGIAHIDGSRALFAALGSNDKVFHELPGYRHESHHETPERVAKLFGTLRGWIEPRLL